MFTDHTMTGDNTLKTMSNDISSLNVAFQELKEALIQEAGHKWLKNETPVVLNSRATILLINQKKKEYQMNFAKKTNPH